ncbi:hypothetical protein TNCV_4254531 [Trichonephila clavipes]|nr:hypothetical protein TNCV_4254531 [Trichonephila clavipes]
MAAVNFLHHENPSTWAGVESTILGTEDQRQTNHATQPTLYLYYASYLWDRGNLAVNVMDLWLAYHVLEPSTTEDTPCSGALHGKSIDAQMSSHWCVVEVSSGDVRSGVVLVT